MPIPRARRPFALFPLLTLAAPVCAADHHEVPSDAPVPGGPPGDVARAARGARRPGVGAGERRRPGPQRRRRRRERAVDRDRPHAPGPRRDRLATVRHGGEQLPRGGLRVDGRRRPHLDLPGCSRGRRVPLRPGARRRRRRAGSTTTASCPWGRIWSTPSTSPRTAAGPSTSARSRGAATSSGWRSTERAGSATATSTPTGRARSARATGSSRDRTTRA